LPFACERQKAQPPKEARTTTNIMGRTTWTTATGYCQAASKIRRNLGIQFIVVPRIHNKQDSIEAARNFLSMAWIDEEHCAQGVRCLDSYCKEWDESTARINHSPCTTGPVMAAMPCKTAPAHSFPTISPPPNDRYYRKPTPASAWAA
jgi:hypothetical protein